MSGQLAFMQSGANFLNIIKENSPLIYGQTGVSNQLTGDTGKYDVSVMNLIIPLKAQHKEEALKFALFLTNKKNQTQLAKLTAVLPVNKEALKDEFFTQFDENNTVSKARYLSAKQLDNLQTQVIIRKNKKEILNAINTAVQQIVLNKSTTQQNLKQASKLWIELEK
jgi:putative chitobiose transport system substrate-binding protein